MKNKGFHKNSTILLNACLGLLVVFSGLCHANLIECIHTYLPFDCKLNSEISPWKKGFVYSSERLRKPNSDYNFDRNSYIKKYSEFELFANQDTFPGWTLSESSFVEQQIIELNESNEQKIELYYYKESYINTSKIMFVSTQGTLQSAESMLLKNWQHIDGENACLFQKLNFYRIVLTPQSTAKNIIRQNSTILMGRKKRGNMQCLKCDTNNNRICNQTLSESWIEDFYGRELFTDNLLYFDLTSFDGQSEVEVGSCKKKGLCGFRLLPCTTPE